MYKYCIHTSPSLSTYQPINLSIYQSINLSIFQSINQSIYLIIYLSIYLSIHPSIYPPMYLCNMYLSLSLSLHLSIHGSIDLSIYRSIDRSIYVWYVHSSLLVCTQGLPKHMGLDSLSDVVFDCLRWNVKLFQNGIWYVQKNKRWNTILWFCDFSNIYVVSITEHYFWCQEMLYVMTWGSKIYIHMAAVLFVWRKIASTNWCLGTRSWMLLCSDCFHNLMAQEMIHLKT